MANRAVDLATEAAQNLLGTAKDATDTTEQNREHGAGCHRPRVAGREGHHQQGDEPPGFGSAPNRETPAPPPAFHQPSGARGERAHGIDHPHQAHPFPIEMF